MFESELGGRNDDDLIYSALVISTEKSACTFLNLSHCIGAVITNKCKLYSAVITNNCKLLYSHDTTKYQSLLCFVAVLCTKNKNKTKTRFLNWKQYFHSTLIAYATLVTKVFASWGGGRGGGVLQHRKVHPFAVK